MEIVRYCDTESNATYGVVLSSQPLLTLFFSLKRENPITNLVESKVKLRVGII
jgi:hypothetical protein